MRELEHVLALFVAAVVLAAAARRVRAPYPVFLAIGGALLGFLPAGPSPPTTQPKNPRSPRASSMRSAASPGLLVRTASAASARSLTSASIMPSYGRV